MTKRKNPVVWVSRNKLSYRGHVRLWNDIPRPDRDRDYLTFRNKYSDLISCHCYSLFSRYTGFKLKPGECKAIRINVEVCK